MPFLLNSYLPSIFSPLFGSSVLSKIYGDFLKPSDPKNAITCTAADLDRIFVVLKWRIPTIANEYSNSVFVHNEFFGEW